MARSKQKRKKTKVKPVPRALGAEPLRALVDRRPREAAEQLLRIHGGAPSPVSREELDALTVRAAGRLRRERVYELAASLLSRAPAEDPRALAERGLLAFARGDDDALRALASQKGLPVAVAQVIAPLVAALDAKPIARAPRGASPALKELYATTRLVADTVAGDPRAMSRASALQGRLRVAMEACAELLVGAPRAEDVHLLRQMAIPDISRLAELALARRAPHAALRLPSPTREALHHALVGLESAGEELVLAARDHRAFDRLERRGDGLLHLAFSAYRGGALRDVLSILDDAVAQGADLRECARLRWMMHDRGARVNDEDLRAFDKAAAALERELARDPRLLAARVNVRLRSAAAHAERAARLVREGGAREGGVATAPELARVAADLEVIEGWVRGTWVDTLPLRCALDRVRARAHLARGEEDAAKQLIERVLQDDPTSTVGWELAIETAPEDERGELARRAREATGATHFEQKARAISGLTPGALAREVLVARPETLAEVFRSVFARARALQAEQRAFLGMGIARILAARGVEVELVEAFLEIWLDDPEAEPTWIAEAFLLEEWAEALRVLRGFLPRAYSSDPSSVSTEALQDLVVVAAAHESDFADVLFGEVALPLTRTELAKLRMRMRSAPADVAFRRARQRADEAHDALHPELCLDQLDDFVDIEDDLLIDDGDWDELDDGLDEEDVDQVLADLRGAPGSLRKDLERAPPAVADGLLRSMLAQLEVPSELFANIPRKAKIDFLCSVLAGGPNTTLETLQAALAVLITSAAGGPRAPRPRTQRKKPKPKRRKKR